MEVGEIRAKLIAETDQFEAGMRQAAAATEKFSTEAEKSLGEVEKSIKSLSWAEAGQGLQKLGNALKGAGADFARAAGQADDLADSLKGAFGDSADQVAAWSQQIGTAFGVFSAQQVGGAAVALEKFGVAGEQNLRRVADIAAGSGQSIESVALAFGKFEKFGDSKSILALQKAVGATNTELAQFGAVLDSSGKILTDTPARADAARAAMESFLDDKFSGAMERQSDASARLAGEMELLKQQLGAGAHELKEQMAPALLDMVTALRGMSPELQGVVGLVTEFGGTALSGAGGAIEMAAHLKTMGLSVAGLKGALAAIPGLLSGLAAGLVAVSGPALILIGTFGALAVGLAAYTNELERANKAAQELLNTEVKRLDGYAKNKDLIGKNAEEIKKAGKGLKEVDALIAGLTDQLERGRAEGLPQAQLDKIAGRLKDARATRSELLKQQQGPVYNKPEAGPEQKAPKVEESEKARVAREKKEQAAAAKAERKRVADEKKRERERLAAQKRQEAKARSEAAKRERERKAAERKAERARTAAEREQKKAADKAAREAERARRESEKEAKKPTEAKKAAAAVAAEGASKPGFFDKFEQDPSTKAFKDKLARNAALAQYDVFTDDRARKASNVQAGLDLLSSATQALPATAPGAARLTQAVRSGAPAETAQAVKEGLAEIRVLLEVKDGGKATRQEQSGPSGKPFKFAAPLGGVS